MAAAAAVTFALGERGKPYVFGANGPAEYDCSSLMVAAWVAGGHALTRRTYTQARDGTATSDSLLSPGSGPDSRLRRGARLSRTRGYVPRVGIFDESPLIAGGKDESLPAIGATASCDVSVVVLESSP